MSVICWTLILKGLTQTGQCQAYSSAPLLGVSCTSSCLDLWADLEIPPPGGLSQLSAGDMSREAGKCV